MKTIGVFGYYDQLNFGDDLMAVVVADAIKSSGCQAKILSSLPHFHRLGYDTESDADALVRQCDAVVLGGGGALLHHSSPDPSASPNQYSKLLMSVNRASLKHGKPVFAVSIGGESKDAVRPLRAGITSLLVNPLFAGGTVRLKSDIEVFSFFEKPTLYFPDILLATSRLYPQSQDARKGTAGIQCQTVPEATRIVRKLKASGWQDIVFLHTHEGTRKKLTRGDPTLAKHTHFLADNITDTLKVLASCGIFVGCRLHLGVVAMSYGSTFHMVNPQKKVVRFFEDLGLAPDFVDFRRLLGKPLPKPETKPVINGLEEAIQCSSGHISYIRDTICGQA